MSTRDKAINYLSMIVGGVVGVSVAYVIYHRTMARAAELTRGEGGSGVPGAGGSVIRSPALSSREPATPDYADIEAGLLDPEAVAALMDDDDLSLWDAPESAYRDDDDNDGNDDDVAARGQGKRPGRT